MALINGRMWKNDYKKSDTQPDLKGVAFVDDVKHDFAAWRKKTDKGDGFSFKISPPRYQQSAKPAPAQQQPAQQEDLRFQYGWR